MSDPMPPGSLEPFKGAADLISAAADALGKIVDAIYTMV